MTLRSFITAVGLLALCAGRIAHAAGPPDYLTEIKPLFKARCYACHGALKQEAGLRLDTVAAIVQGGDAGAVLQPGAAAASELVARITSADLAVRMPPEGKPLSASQIEKIVGWIDAGAAPIVNEQPDEDPAKHWAFQPVIRPELPTVKNGAWVRNPIDAFVAAEQDRRELSPSPEADPAILLRRLYLDLTGVPPTRQELARFLNDRRPDAYERTVETLLGSPHYGERWGRHWMDVWRYSDWYGRRAVPDVMNSYARIWRWRDWIVRSLNEDKGYDRMVVEMLAADEVAPDDDANLPATGFVVRNWYKWNYNTWMKDAVEHTGKAFLGLTLNCSHCHDHKYDPISQEDYFAFRAIFEPLELRHDRVAGEPDPGPFKKYVYGASYGPIASGAIRVFDEKLDATTLMYKGGDSRNIIPGRPPVPPGVPKSLGAAPFAVQPVSLPARAWYPGLKPFVQQEEVAKAQATIATLETELTAANTALSGLSAADESEEAKAQRRIAQAVVAMAERKLAAAKADLGSLQARIAADNARYGFENGDAGALAKAAAKAERQATLAAAELAGAAADKLLADAEARPAADAERCKAIDAANAAAADSQKLIAAAREATLLDSDQYAPIGPTYPKESTGRRLALARWIAHRDNPLTARVAVNHLWMRHFGAAIVPTTFDFGRNGKRPLNQPLLDWLAAELMDKDWSMKAIHRLIVNSSTYRQRSSARRDAPQARIDPDNTALWRFNSGRMEAEVVRDSVLFLSGSLDPAIGGEEIDHAQGLTSLRRSLYFTHHGESKMEFLELFDGANACDCYQRSSSIMPQQALAMANSELTLRGARQLAASLWSQAGAESAGAAVDAAFVRAAFEQVLGRSPSAAEVDASLQFLERQTVAIAAAATATPPAENAPVPSDAAGRSRESLIHALFNHNDFVTIR